MTTTPVFLVITGGTAASDRWNPAVPGGNAVRWDESETGGSRPSPCPVDARSPWAGVVASRLRRAALLAERPAG